MVELVQAQVESLGVSPPRKSGEHGQQQNRKRVHTPLSKRITAYPAAAARRSPKSGTCRYTPVGYAAMRKERRLEPCSDCSPCFPAVCPDWHCCCCACPQPSRCCSIATSTEAKYPAGYSW